MGYDGMVLNQPFLAATQHVHKIAFYRFSSPSHPFAFCRLSYFLATSEWQRTSLLSLQRQRISPSFNRIVASIPLGTCPKGFKHFIKGMGMI